MQTVAPQLATVMENYKVSLVVGLFTNYSCSEIGPTVQWTVGCCCWWTTN